jgi:hypothetical protein
VKIKLVTALPRDMEYLTLLEPSSSDTQQRFPIILSRRNKRRLFILSAILLFIISIVAVALATNKSAKVIHIRF